MAASQQSCQVLAGDSNVGLPLCYRLDNTRIVAELSNGASLFEILDSTTGTLKACYRVNKQTISNPDEALRLRKVTALTRHDSQDSLAS